MDTLEKKISILIEDQFPSFYKDKGQDFVQFVTEYYKWLESFQVVNNSIQENGYVSVIAQNSTIIGTKSKFTEHFTNSCYIAIHKDLNNYELLKIDTVISDRKLTVQNLPTFSNNKTLYSNCKMQYNPLYYSRNMMEIRDVDETPTSFLKYFKKKYLLGIQFETNSNIRRIIKNSLDIYRSKGTERSIDLMFRLVYGTNAEVYYPSRDIFKLSSGHWKIPKYLEVSLNENNHLLKNKKIIGLESGAYAYVEDVVKRTVKNRLIDLIYIDNIVGTFKIGERIDSSDNILKESKIYIRNLGSLQEVLIDRLGSGTGYSKGNLLDIYSFSANGSIGRVLETTNATGLIDFDLINGGYAYSEHSNVLISNKILVLDDFRKNTSINNTSNYFYDFETVYSPQSNLTLINSNGISSNLTGTISLDSTSNFLTGNGTSFNSNFSNNDYISIYSNSTSYETFKILNVINSTYIQLFSNSSFTNSIASYFKSNKFSNGDLVFCYYSNGTLAGNGTIIDHIELNTTSSTIRVAINYGNISPLIIPNANLVGNVIISPNSYNLIGQIPNANLTGNVYTISHKNFILGDGTLFDSECMILGSNSSGTVSVNNSSTDIFGSGTSFDIDLGTNYYISIHSNSSHFESRKIQSITNSTHLIVNSFFTFTNSVANYSYSKPVDSIVAYSNSTNYEIRQINSIVNSNYLTIKEKFTFTNSIATFGNTKSSGTKFIIPGSNLTGTVEIKTACNIIVGTSTDFQNDFEANSFIVLYSNSTAYEIQNILSISNSTHLTLSNVTTFSNSTVTYANTSTNNSITYGKYLGIYTTNSSSYFIGQVNLVVNDSFLTFQNKSNYNNSYTSFANTNGTYTIYNTGNNVVANIFSYNDITSYANVIGMYSNSTLNVSNVIGNFTSNETLYCYNSNNDIIGTATFLSYSITSGSNGILKISNINGNFLRNTTIKNSNNSVNSYINKISITIGVIDVNNAFSNSDNNKLYFRDSNGNSSIIAIGNGTGASVSFSNDLIYSEHIDFINEYLRDFANVGLDAFAYGMTNTVANVSTIIIDALGVTNTSIGKVYSLEQINPGRNYNYSPIVKIYEPYTYSYSERDYILAVKDINGIFEENEIINQPAIANSRGLIQFFTTDLSLFPGTLSNTVTHLLFVERLHLKDSDSFIPTINSITNIIGHESSTTANIVSVHINDRSLYLGYNAKIEANVVTGTGLVTKLEVIDSAFGFKHDESVYFSNNTIENSTEGFGVGKVYGFGKSLGFYKTNDGFLSSNKKLYDGYYYQPYSYDVLSSIPLDKYVDMLYHILHVLGTKNFATFRTSTHNESFSSISNSSVTIE